MERNPTSLSREPHITCAAAAPRGEFVSNERRAHGSRVLIRNLVPAHPEPIRVAHFTRAKLRNVASPGESIE